jgi:uncharacterized protein GlcG (DUF336 family)
VLAAVALPLLLGAQPARLLDQKALSLEAARKIAGAAEGFARKNQWNVCIAILDGGANLVYFQRMDGVQIGSIAVSMEKAESSVKFKRPSKAFSDAVATRPQVMDLPGALAIEGGLPLIHEGQVIGAIGVSGVTSEQDGMIAKAGADALASMK